MFQKLWFDFRLISVYFYLILIEILTAQGFKNIGEYCKYNNTSVQNVQDMCQPMLVCYQNQCKCRLGYGYSAPLAKCLDFDEYLCTDDVDCNGVDSNRLCDHKTNTCQCNRFNGYYETKDSRLCKSRHSFLNQSCSSDNECANDFSYCQDSLCKCWPEFLAQTDYLVPVAGHRIGVASIPATHCVRKICYENSNCQTYENPNLICNNTICECEYGYGLDSHRTCVKMTRRQNCNITCQIIGGLFASIFMLSLIYWCFYCCYSIVKNYKMHNRSRNCVNSNHMIDGSPQMPRFMRRPQHTYPDEQTFPINGAERHYFCHENETPPTYSQISDEPPDYETVVHMKATD